MDACVFYHVMIFHSRPRSGGECLFFFELECFAEIGRNEPTVISVFFYVFSLTQAVGGYALVAGFSRGQFWLETNDIKPT